MSVAVALIGAGLMGRWHAFYAKKNKAKILAVVDPDAKAASRLARLHGASALSNMQELLGSFSPEIVHICSPLSTHKAIALAALDHGAHVIVEKPLTDTAKSTHLLLDYRRDKQLLVVPVHQFAFQRGVGHVLEALPSLGQPLRLQFTICSAGGISMSRASLDGLLADILPHPLSVLQRLWPCSTVDPKEWHVKRITDGELDAHGYWGAARISLTISLNARPTCCLADLYATHGTARIDFFHGFSTVRRGALTRVEKTLAPFREAGGVAMAATANLVERVTTRELAYPGLSSLISHSYAASRGKSPPPFSREDIIKTAEMRDHIVAAAGLIRSRL